MPDALRSGDPIAATAWLDEDVPTLEGDDVTISAELSDVDEVAVVIEWFNVDERQILVHLPRVQAHRASRTARLGRYPLASGSAKGSRQ